MRPEINAPRGVLVPFPYESTRLRAGRRLYQFLAHPLTGETNRLLFLILVTLLALVILLFTS